MFVKSLISVTVLLAAQAKFGSACSQGQPAIKDDNTATLNFFGDSDALVQTISLGAVGTCHTLNGGANTFNIAVGQNLFGRNLRIETWPSSDCSGEFQVSVLTNAATCYISDLGDWHSVKLAQT